MSRMTNKKINTRIISILFAVALWLYVASDQNPTEYKPIKDVPVQLINAEAIVTSGLVIKNPQQYKIDVNIQGKRSVLAEIKAGEIIAEADLRGHTQRGVNNVPIEVRGLPSNVELVDYSPKSIKVDMEQISSIQVPVTVSTEGRPMEGYTTLASVVTPGEVLVSGPESLLNNIRVITAVMKMAGSTGDQREVLAVKAVDDENNDVAGVTLNPNIVEVTVPVRKTKQVAIEPVVEGQPSAEWEITDIFLKMDTIVIYGEESVLQTINSIRTEPVSLAGIDRNTNFNVGLIMPEGVAPVENINSATVYVRGEGIINRETPVDRVNLSGLEEGLRFSDETSIPTVQVTVRGKESIINQLTAGDFFVTASLEGLAAGKHTVTLKVDLPRDIEIVSIAPLRVEIELVALDEEEE